MQFDTILARWHQLFTWEQWLLALEVGWFAYWSILIFHIRHGLWHVKTLTPLHNCASPWVWREGFEPKAAPALFTASREN